MIAALLFFFAGWAFVKACFWWCALWVLLGAMAAS